MCPPGRDSRRLPWSQTSSTSRGCSCPRCVPMGAARSFASCSYSPQNPAQPRTQLLCGFFPLERRPRYQQLPIATLGLWQHAHCYLRTPLLRAGFADPALAAFFDWLNHDSRSCPLLELSLVPSEGPFHQHLVDHLQERVTFLAQSWTRALLKPSETAEAYLAAVSGTLRRALKRKKKPAGRNRRAPLSDISAGWKPRELAGRFSAPGSERLEGRSWDGPGLKRDRSGLFHDHRERSISARAPSHACLALKRPADRQSLQLSGGHGGICLQERIR